MFKNIYKNKKVLLTGNTGFKGSWLTCWLLEMGAQVHGISNGIPSNPSMFEELDLKNKITYYEEDIRDLAKLKPIINNVKPDFIFHLAAQAIVSTSYSEPVETFSTNVMGTVNVLESIRNLTNDVAVVIITSDKCYDNVEWVWGYKETDALGGKDIYSGSKGAAELAFKSYYHSFIKYKKNIKIATARAGNVIGGGDWAKDRLVPDCFRAWNAQKVVEIRSPSATRPWQHVLEPLSGYLHLAMELTNNPQISGESYNFGPGQETNYTVLDLLEHLSKIWGHASVGNAYNILDNIPFHEAQLLKLNCDKALFDIKWIPTFDYEKTYRAVGDWYREYYQGQRKDLYNFTCEQINSYVQIAKERRVAWSN